MIIIVYGICFTHLGYRYSRWRVIRSQLLDKSYKFPEVIKPEAKEASDSWGISGADDWGVADADDWGDDGGDQKEGRRKRARVSHKFIYI